MSEYTFKVIIIGDPAVGKTSLINRFIEDKFEANYKETIGTNILRKEVEIGDTTIYLTLWDIAGQERWTEMRHIYYQGAAGCILVYDVTRPITFKHLTEYWCKDLTNFIKTEIPVVLIGNKIDLPANLKRVKSDEGEELGGQLNVIKFIETSALSGQNVEKTFETISKVLISEKGST